MDTEKTVTLESALEAFGNCRYAEAAEQFASQPDSEDAAVYALAAGALAGSADADSLTESWEKAAAMVRGAGNDRFCGLAETLYSAFSVLTANVYQKCNRKQQMAFAVLNKDVSLEKKEYVLTEMRRILLEADKEYHAIFRVIFSYVQMVTERGAAMEAVPDSLKEAVLKYAKSAVELAQEVGLPKDLSLLDPARQCCALELEGNETLVALRNQLLTAALTGQEALDQWDFFAPFAADAGIEKKTLEKAARREARKEKWKIWKYWGKYGKRS